LVRRPAAERRIRARHAAYFRTLAGQAAGVWDGPEQGAWLDRLETEHDNLRAALAWTLEGAGDRRAGLALAAHLAPFWWRRGHTEEGRRWSRLALAVLDRVGPALRVSVLEGAGTLAWNQSDYIMARAHFEAALAIVRARRNRKGMAHLLSNLALLAQEQGEYERALALGRESLAGFRRGKDAQGVARALGNLGVVSDNLGQFAEAERYYREALERFSALGNRRAVAISYANLAGVATRDPARIEEALALLEQALAVFRALGDTRGMAFTMYDLAHTLMQKGEPGILPRAAALMAESLKLERDVGNSRAVHICLHGLAGLAAEHGDRYGAMRLYGAEEAVRRAVGAARPPSDQEAYLQVLAQLRAALGEQEAAAAWAAGQALSLDEAVALALALAERMSIEAD
jgi:tetratricopeptide (TPR) repeat protein